MAILLPFYTFAAKTPFQNPGSLFCSFFVTELVDSFFLETHYVFNCVVLLDWILVDFGFQNLDQGFQRIWKIHFGRWSFLTSYVFKSLGF